jgi:hypothetical protein
VIEKRTYEVVAPDGGRWELCGLSFLTHAVLIRDGRGWFVYRWKESQYSAISAVLDARAMCREDWLDIRVVPVIEIERRMIA